MEKKNTVPMLEKALDMLEYIGASSTAVSLPELQENLEIAQASCYRIATTLVRRGWLEKCSGNRYEIAAGVSAVAEKARFRLEKYKHLQPVMNRIANTIGFSAKFSVRDGDEFVNVCSARYHSGLLAFSEPGFRSPLKEIASISTIFLTEQASPECRCLILPDSLPLFESLSGLYKEKGYCFILGQTRKNAEYPFDTLSFPVKRKNILLGVISFLSLPGQLESEREDIAAKIEKILKGLVYQL